MAISFTPHLAEATLDAIGDGVVSADAGGLVTYLNPAAEDMTGWSRRDALGRRVDTVVRLIDPATGRPVPNPLLQAITPGAPVGLPPHCVMVGRDGRETPVEDSTAPIHDPARAVVGAVMVFRHVGATLARSLVMAHAALHDPLTGLPNRQLLLDRLSSALAVRDRRHRSVAVAFVDVDGFKRINDTLGHPAGDRLLQAIGARLRAAVRQSDTVGRFGGDEFLVVCTNLGAREQAAIVGQALAAAAAGPHRLDGREVSVSVSVGMALHPRDGRDGPTLIARADRAMYAAKAEGGGHVGLVEPAAGAALGTGRRPGCDSPAFVPRCDAAAGRRRVVTAAGDLATDHYR